jgi:hypothetical protein
MSIKSGRYGQVKMGVDEATAVVVVSLNNWTISLATERIEVTCFQDTNKVYVPGMRDISGSVGGFWNSAELAIIDATDDDVPVYLELTPNTNEPTFLFSGPAYIDAEIEVPVSGAPTMSGNFGAGGSWTLPPVAP